ncbi:MAG: hypothetical protein ABIH00_02660 [Armatimonadota bacterium]
MNLTKSLELIHQLNNNNVDYIIVGGIALLLHGVVRATEYIDIFIKPTADNIVKTKKALKSVWDDSSIEEISETDLLGDYPALRYGPPDDSISVDILTKLGEAVTFNDLEVETIDIEGIKIKVATVKTLIDMKKDTVRLRDKADVEALRNLYGKEVD